jgi:hypothetical protein
MNIPGPNEVLEIFLPSVENLPGEIQYLLSELVEDAREQQTLENSIKHSDNELRKAIKTMASGLIGAPPVGTSTEDSIQDSENSGVSPNDWEALSKITKSMIRQEQDQVQLCNRIISGYDECLIHQAKRSEMIEKARDTVFLSIHNIG